MKKTAILVLIAACIVSLIVYIAPKKQKVLNVNSYSDVEGVFVEVDSISAYQDKKMLNISWNNNTEYEIVYGGGYWIEKEENGQWVNCAVGNVAFALLGYILNPGEKIDTKLLLTGFYEIGEPGKYRYCSTFGVEGTDKKECLVQTEFIVD